MNASGLFIRIVLATSLALGSVVSAHEPAKPAPTPPEQGKLESRGMPVFVQNVAPEATDAVAVVDAFSAAIKAVKLDIASQLLDAKVLILESGGSERSRDEYMGGHAIADAAFMQTAQQQLRYRQAQALGDVAWVATESELQTSKDGKPSMVASTETMVLKKTASGWKIVHIHWSSHAIKAEKNGH